MLTIVWHSIKNTKALLVFAIFILLYLLTSFRLPDDVQTARYVMIYSSMTLTLAYSGVAFLSLIFTEHRQGSIFLLLSSPHSRTVIYLSKFLSAFITLVVLLLFQLVISGYKNFGSEVFFRDILPNLLPRIFYQSLANALFFGSVWSLIGQCMRPALNRWLVMVVALYGAISSVYLIFLVAIRTGLGGNLVDSSSLFFDIVNVLFYQHLIFLAESPMLSASLFFAGSIVLFALGGFWFARRDFNAL
ncbi:ABC transporter permease [Candidatus Haliotispira prima]|uniref:ABC transporter permease n=1 Tax=Candidatus Haliotispira prima TaxID=3034016 RepID=A0ABY8MEA5_9SPIO|nr:ABC transporter permease [Candidatus Haliotispira prima]